MASVKEVEAQKLIKKVAEKLKGMEQLKQPGWAAFVKTGVSRERVPQQEDWWYIRGASILRRIYVQNQGVSKLRKAYSGRKNYGHAPEHGARGSGKIIRTLLQQLETAGLLKTEKGKGRLITSEGQKFLDGVAKEAK